MHASLCFFYAAVEQMEQKFQMSNDFHVKPLHYSQPRTTRFIHRLSVTIALHLRL